MRELVDSSESISEPFRLILRAAKFFFRYGDPSMREIPGW